MNSKQQGIASECVDLGEGSINSQLRNFGGIASECVDPGVGGQSTINLGRIHGDLERIRANPPRINNQHRVHNEGESINS